MIIEEMVDDLACFTRVVEGLLGPNSVAHQKTCTFQTTGKIDWLGWEINATRCLVGIANTNVLRAFYEFFEVNHDAVAYVQEYSYAWLHGRVDIRLNAASPTADNRPLRRGKGIEKRRFVEATLTRGGAKHLNWRVILVAMELEGEGHSSRLETFTLKQHFFVAEYDGSLTGCGFRILRVEEGREGSGR